MGISIRLSTAEEILPGGLGGLSAPQKITLDTFLKDDNHLLGEQGGVGKTRTALLTANCLGAAGRKVLLIDLDFNNSVTSYYLDEDLFRQADSRTIADALSRETNDLSDYRLPHCGKEWTS
jgi:hypothetical protein